MFIAAIAHLLAFPVTPYRLEITQSWWRNILNAANVSDVHSDVVEHCKHIGSKVGSLSNSFAGSLYKISSSQDRIKQINIDETSHLLDNESFNSYSYASNNINRSNIETASNFSNTAISSKMLNNNDQSSLVNLYPSSLTSNDQNPNTFERALKGKNVNADIDEIIEVIT